MKDSTKERDKKCIPIAQKVIELISKHDVMIGNVEKEKTIEHYKELEEKIIKFYLLKELTSGEVIYIQQLVLQAVDIPLNFVKASIIDSYERATEKMFGKPERDINLSDIDKVLTSKK